MELKVRVTQRKARSEAEDALVFVRRDDLAAGELKVEIASIFSGDWLARRDGVAARARAGECQAEAEATPCGRATARQDRSEGQIVKRTAGGTELVNDLDRFDPVRHWAGLKVRSHDG
ncbi:hypothetical protein XH92_37150 [Bradyrhizobium sp. CCBAU 53421]|nr:hypothetical protein XH92_37150 [Bradyrhizobium sp. CCBAU 53421]